MNTHSLIVLTFTLILDATISSAQSSVTLEECLEWSATRNPAIQSLQFERSLDRPGRWAAIGQFLPSVSAGFSIGQSSYYNPTFLNSDGSISTYPRTQREYDTYIDDFGYLRVDTATIRDVVIPIPEGNRRTSSAFIRIEEVIFDGGTNYYRYKSALLALSAREARIADEVMLVRNQVTSAYADAVFTSRQIDLASKNVAQRRLQLDFAGARLSAGSVTKRDVLLAEVELGRALSDSLQAILANRRAEEELIVQIGLPLDTVITLAGLKTPFLPPWSLEELEATALGRNDVSALRMNSDRLEYDVQMEKANYLPRISAGLSHDRTERSSADDPFTLNPRNRSTSVDLTLSWLLFDRFSRELNLQQVKVELNKTEIDLRNLEIEVRRQVRNAWEALHSVYLQVGVAQDNSRLAAQTLEFEQERYRLGSATLIDLNAAQLSYFQAETERIRLESDFLSGLGNLETAVGQPLTER